jgi:hypothetical protein
VLIELKTNKITHQDIGQLDMYVRMFNYMKKREGDNPTIGILLCTETDKTIARYSVLNENKQLFAAKYMPYLPTEDELINENPLNPTAICLSHLPRHKNNRKPIMGYKIQGKNIDTRIRQAPCMAVI